MFIEFQCRCGHEFRTKPDNAGRSITCPNCLSPNVVPDAGSTSFEIPSHEERRSLAPPVPRDQTPKDAEPVMRAERHAPDHQSDVIAKKRRSSPVIPVTPRIHRTKSSSSRSKHRGDSAPRDDVDHPSPAHEFEQLDNWTSPRRKRRKAADDDSHDEPKRGKGKSKKPKREQSSNLPLVIGGTVATLLFLGVIAVFALPRLMTVIRDSGKIKTPQEFEKYENTDFNFRCEVPKDWDVEARGGSGNIPPSVRIEKGSVKIVYRSSQSGAAIQDMSQAQANMAGGELADELQPVARVHDYQRDKFTQDMPNYKEIGPTEKIDTGWGEGRLSIFTASSGFSGTIYGYRVTLLTSQFQWNVVCQCATKREFVAYQPLFRRMISSTGR